MDTSFIDELASAAPTPGGGGASAYVGAIAAALSSMVGELTIGKKRYADVEEETLGSLGRLAVLRTRLLALVEEDAQAFVPLAAAYAMPNSTKDDATAKEEAMQYALAKACEPPLAIMQACLDVVHECSFMAHNGSRLAISDAGACAVLAKAATISASLNVYINAHSMKCQSDKDFYQSKADALIQECSDLADGVYAYVASQIGGYQ